MKLVQDLIHECGSIDEHIYDDDDDNVGIRTADSRNQMLQGVPQPMPTSKPVFSGSFQIEAAASELRLRFVG